MFMNSTRLGTMLLAFGLALSAILSTQTAHALADPVDYGPPATDANGAVYCVSSYVASQYPGCVPPPLPTKTYTGQPISVEDAKNIPWGTMRTSVNVLRNDAIQKRSKIREIELIGQRPELTGLRTWVYKKEEGLVRDEVRAAPGLPGRGPGRDLLPRHRREGTSVVPGVCVLEGQVAAMALPS